MEIIKCRKNKKVLHSWSFLGPQPAAALRSPVIAAVNLVVRGTLSPGKNEFLLLTFQVQVVQATPLL